MYEYKYCSTIYINDRAVPLRTQFISSSCAEDNCYVESEIFPFLTFISSTEICDKNERSLGSKLSSPIISN